MTERCGVPYESLRRKNGSWDATRWSTLFAAASISLLSAVGCSGEKDGACEDGETRTCTGLNECSGRQICESGRWAACNCPASSGVGGAGGTGHEDLPAVSGAAGTLSALPEIGGPCDEDGDCPEPAFCLGPTGAKLFGGGAPSGVCVADCTEDASACDAFRGAACIDTSPVADGPGTTRLCLERCEFAGADLEQKCHRRVDVACEELEGSDGEGFCRPLCSVDAECGDRRCDRRLGVCRSAELVTPDTRFGSECDAEAEEPGCVGVCLELDDALAVCSHRCVFGSADDCAALGEDQPSACQFVSPGGTIGDIGYCGELCDCNDECTAPSAICAAFADATLENVFGHLGSCAPAGAAGEGLPCL